VNASNGAITETERHEGEDEHGIEATLMSISGEAMDEPEFTGEYYEPWLFKTMLKELSERELGVGFIYSIIERFADRHELTDVVVVLDSDSIGSQMFRLGGAQVPPSLAAQIGDAPGVYCEPDIVPAVECDAVRTACQLSFSLHRARFGAERDPLTNIANRRAFDRELELAAARSARSEQAFTLVLIDLNGFKSVNDQLGHDVGDYLLRQFGFALRKSVRQVDTAARIGGDEFAVILNDTKGAEWRGFGERLRGHLISSGNMIDYTVGTATAPIDSTNPTELLRMADVRLYEKKGKPLQ